MFTDTKGDGLKYIFKYNIHIRKGKKPITLQTTKHKKRHRDKKCMQGITINTAVQCAMTFNL